MSFPNKDALVQLEYFVENKHPNHNYQVIIIIEVE